MSIMVLAAVAHEYESSPFVESHTGPVRGSMPQSPELLRRLLRAKDRMDGAPHEEWTVHRLAQVSAVSVSHFARSFKAAFGVPPHRYLLTRRIERSVALLRDTDLPITDIAFQTGWKSLGTFGRIFRDITGETPGTLRALKRSSAHSREHVPECILRAVDRPDLKMAVVLWSLPVCTAISLQIAPPAMRLIYPCKRRRTRITDVRRRAD